MSTLVPLGIPVTGEGFPRIATPRFQAHAPIEVIFTAPDVDVEVPHRLERMPVGYLVVGRESGTVQVYNGSVDSTESSVTLRSSSAGRAWVLIL